MSQCYAVPPLERREKPVVAGRFSFVGRREPPRRTRPKSRHHTSCAGSGRWSSGGQRGG